MKKPTADNPILNGPYDEPAFHYSTDASGNLNYADVRSGRRVFAPDVSQIPLNQSAQGSMFDLNDSAAEYREQIVNQVRERVSQWRNDGYPGVSSRVTRDLLQFWFNNPERQSWQNLFFAQREAVETAIWLNEVAAKSNPGTHILNQIRDAQKTAATASEDILPRVAFKMATGAGKTVVMACLILYHYLNRQETRADTRFADYFLLVAPGITIRDRLSVLLWDASTDNPQQARDYYRQRNLVPPLYASLMSGLNARIAITNYHAFEPRLLSGNKKSPFDGKLQADGSKFAEREDVAQTLKRVLGKFKPGRRLIVINDEAHHCYLPKAKGKDTEEEKSETENQRAAIWFSGLREVAKRYRVGTVYDLSATPYYLSGSGYPAYSLFPWVVTDYGLIEAIEAGLVKIPFLPVDDSSQQIEEPVLRNIYEHCRDQLPKKGQRGQRKQAKDDEKAGKAIAKPVELPPDLPSLVKVALEKFVAHYQRYDEGLRESGERGRDLLSEPPVFIVVCNNTTVSKEVYKYIAGYEVEDESGERVVRPGLFDIFSNYDRNTLAARRKPPTLLIDSDALENSDQVGDDFKKVFAPEIAQFKREYRLAHPERSADDLTDGDILREVVNTVGKRGALGSHVRCVVSVSMLTEGWDANTVTHIMGLRAFGSQLLCEQVAGRALRRRNYFIDPKTGKFPPEYAHIIGVPFKFFKGGETGPVEKVEVATLRALPDRAELEIRFPQLIGYRQETPPGEVFADFSAVPDYEISLASLPIMTELGSVFTGTRQKLELSEKLEHLRDQEVVFWLTTKLIQTYYADHEGGKPLARFSQLRAIADEWYRTKVKVIGETNPIYKRILRYVQDAKPLADAIQQGIVAHAATTERILPVFNHYNRIGSTRNVFGHTIKATYPTKKSHVNLVVADTQSWEQIAAKTLEQMPEVESYVKNAFLGFNIPYVQEGKERQYMPDFIARIRTEDGIRFNLIIEITGFSKDKTQKRWYLEHRWLPAVNTAHEKIVVQKTRLRFKSYADDFPMVAMPNMWLGLGGAVNKRYVVQTNEEVIKRCLLMTTDPGDLVLDPTCGSGTTAYVAEQWGRRWITTDTSRIALNIAKTRLMTATFPWYVLADEKAGKDYKEWDVRHGFDYKTVPHITLKSLANDEPPETETLYDQPAIDKKKLRVAGPFTVETLQASDPLPPEALADASLAADDLQNFTQNVFSHLKSAGVKNGAKNETAVFTHVNALGHDVLHAEGFYQAEVKGTSGERKAYIHIGPQFGAVSRSAVNTAVKEARVRGDADWLIILGFAFESDIDTEQMTSLAGFVVTKARMHDDLLQAGLLKKDKKAASFITIGEPDVALHCADGKVTVEILGLDIYDPIRDDVKARSVADISYWMVDDDYDGSNFMVRQVFFCGGDRDEFDKWKRGLSDLAKQKTKKKVECTLKVELDDEAFDRLYGFVSHPIEAKAGRKVAVRVVSQFGEESTKVLTVSSLL